MRIVCGLDMHIDSIFLCILSSTGEIFEKKYGVLTNQLEEMRDLMLTYQPLFRQAASRTQERGERCTVDSRVHDVRMGRKPNQRLLLQPFLLPSDTSQKKEQDESGGGHITQRCAPMICFWIKIIAVRKKYCPSLVCFTKNSYF